MAAVILRNPDRYKLRTVVARAVQHKNIQRKDE